MSMLLASFMMGLGLRISQFKEGEGSNAPGVTIALAFNYDLSSGSQFNLLWGGI